jgi:hypothetical protein
MNRKALDYSLAIMFIVIVALPLLYWRMNTKIEVAKETMGEDQILFLQQPYDKEDIISYIEKSAELAMEDITKGAEQLKQDCTKDTNERIAGIFNKKLDTYIKAYNKRSTVKIPENNYELYINGNDINAIAILPIEKPISRLGREIDALGTIWFAPSFTTQSEKLASIANTLAQKCTT